MAADGCTYERIALEAKWQHKSTSSAWRICSNKVFRNRLYTAVMNMLVQAP